jgi:internalin A
LLFSNQIRDIKGLEAIIKKEKFEELQIDNNLFLKDIPLSLKENENHKDALLKYFSDLKFKTTRKDEMVEIRLPAKVLLLGNHGTGKSTFLYYLQNNNKLPEPNELESTPILKIEPYQWEEDATTGIKLPKAMIYDFGGQDYYHGLYRAFFSEESVNLLFWWTEFEKNDIRKDSKDIYTRDFTREYWLHQLNTPVLLVQTHADTDKPDNIVNSDKIKKYAYISLNNEEIEVKKDEERLSDLKSLKAKFLKLIESKRVKVPKIDYYPAFLNYILSPHDAGYILVKEDIFDKQLYGRKPISGETNDDLLRHLKVELQELHDQGLVLYYKDKDKLDNVVWLNPTKTVENIHENILSEQKIRDNKDRDKGIVKIDDFDNLCNDEKIKELLLSEKVIFFDKYKEQYVVPGYLQLSDKDDLHKILVPEFMNPDFTLKFQKFIPFGLINQLICFYGNIYDTKRYWRDQLIFLFDKSCRVWIKLDFSQLTIAVYINHFNNKKTELKPDEIERCIFFNIIDLYNGKDIDIKFPAKEKSPEIAKQEKDKENPRDFTQQVRDYIKPENRKDKFTPPSDMYISVDGENFIHYADLESIEERRIQAYALTETKIKTRAGETIKKINTSTNRTVFVSNYLKFSNNKNIKEMKKIFISYAHEDDKYKNELMLHLKPMQRNGLIDKPFVDTNIELSAEWKVEILKNLTACDIMICLISKFFINSEFINVIELKKAMEDSKKIIPIIISPCNWESEEFAKFQGPLGGKPLSLYKDEKGYIKDYTENERDFHWTEIVKKMQEKLSETR